MTDLGPYGPPNCASAITPKDFEFIWKLVHGRTLETCLYNTELRHFTLFPFEIKGFALPYHAYSFSHLLPVWGQTFVLGANFTSAAIFLPEIVFIQYTEILHEAICAMRSLPLPFSVFDIDHNSSIFIFLQHVEDYTIGQSSLLYICQTTSLLHWLIWLFLIFVWIFLEIYLCWCCEENVTN